MRKNKFMSIIVSSMVTIPSIISITSPAVCADIESIIPTPIEKQSIVSDNMIYTVETYNDKSLHITAQNTEFIYVDYTDVQNKSTFNIATISFPVNSYSITYESLQLSYINSISELELIEDSFIDTFQYSQNFYDSYHINTGAVAEFILTPVSELANPYEVSINNIPIQDVSGILEIPLTYEQYSENYLYLLYKTTNLEKENETLTAQIEGLNKNIDNLHEVINDNESTINKLNEKINTDNSILKYDINGDGFVDAVDASAIMMIYAVNSTGGSITTIDDYYNHIASQETVWYY